MKDSLSHRARAALARAFGREVESEPAVQVHAEGIVVAWWPCDPDERPARVGGALYLVDFSCHRVAAFFPQEPSLIVRDYLAWRDNGFRHGVLRIPARGAEALLRVKQAFGLIQPVVLRIHRAGELGFVGWDSSLRMLQGRLASVGVAAEIDSNGERPAVLRSIGHGAEPRDSLADLFFWGEKAEPDGPFYWVREFPAAGSPPAG